MTTNIYTEAKQSCRYKKELPNRRLNKGGYEKETEAFKVFCGCILFGKGPHNTNTEGLRSALARLRNRTGPSIPQPPPPPPAATPQPSASDCRELQPTSTTNIIYGSSQNIDKGGVPCTTRSIREECLQQPVTSKPSGKDESLSDSIASNHFQTITNNANTKACILTQRRSSSNSPTTFGSTRSAAMMALTLRSQPPNKPTAMHYNKNARPSLGGGSGGSAESTFSLTEIPQTPPLQPKSQQLPPPPTPPLPPPAPLQIANDFNYGGGDSSTSSSSDNDALNVSTSSSATALRRLYFKSGRNTKAKQNSNCSIDSSNLNAAQMARNTTIMMMTTTTTAMTTTMTTTNNASMIPFNNRLAENIANMPGSATNGSNVPKVVIMGSSSASMTDTNINTSTDSASTMVTNVTHTDTSETCDSLDLGDISVQGEPIFSSLEEPLLTTIQIDSEQDETEMELVSATRPNINMQDSTESQESSLSIILGDISSTTPLLANKNHSITPEIGKERLPSTAPPPTRDSVYFTFDLPQPSKSARCSDKSQTFFVFKEEDASRVQNSRQKYEEFNQSQRYKEKYDNDYGGGGGGGGYSRQKNANKPIENDSSKLSRAKVSQTRSTRNRSSALKTSPNRERKYSTSSSSSGYALKETTFLGKSTTSPSKKLSPSSSAQHASAQCKYGRNSLTGEAGEKDLTTTLFPFDREAIEYERTQRKGFIPKANSSSSSSNTSESDEAELCSVYEKPNKQQISPKNAESYHQQYALLMQQDQGQVMRKNSSKRHRAEAANKKYMPTEDAFRPKKNNSNSPTMTKQSPHAELKRFEDIANKFEQMPPNSAKSTTSPSASSVYNNNNSQHLLYGAGMNSDNVIQLHANHHHVKSNHVKSKPSELSTLNEGESLNECYDIFAVSHSSSGGSINVTSNPLEVAVCKQPRATIVVQQPSLSLDNTIETLVLKNESDFISVEQGKEAAGNISSLRKHNLNLHHGLTTSQQQKREDNIRQLLDVTNTLTFEEIRDFEMRYGSPHHSRSQSVKNPSNRPSGRPNHLSLPQQRSRVASMPNTGVEEEYYRLRHFSITGKGVVNRGDSLKSRRSRSNNSVASSNSSNEHLTTQQMPVNMSSRNSSATNRSLASSQESSNSNTGGGPFRVLMLGAPAVGKSSLVSQFMTSEYLHVYDTSIDDDSGEKSVSVLLSGEESELIFIDHPYAEMPSDDCLNCYDPHGYCVIYSASDRTSFSVAEHILQVLWTNQNIAQKAVILVANKADLARSRLVSVEEGKAMATAYDCKFIETSVGINHNVDELLVGLLSQIRLKLENPEKSRDLLRKRSIRKSKKRACSPLSGVCLAGLTSANSPIANLSNIITNTSPGSTQSSPRKYRNSRTSTSLKVKGLLGRVWARDSKSKSCENLHVL